MLKIFDWIFKIITLPFTIISLPFKILDWIFKIFGLIVILVVVYWFDWIPMYSEFINTTFPEIANYITNIKNVLGFAQKIPINKIPLDKIQQATDYLTK
jgi:hypothetical protein